jgi:glyoxylase-like metal-dependent hydrolase (beta-lactamase superfamily II)
MVMSLLRPAVSILSALLFALIPAQPAQAQEEIPINLERLSDRVLVTWACDYFQGTNMAVIVTDDGLVVIDTGLSPSTVRRQRARVEEELGRNDFRFLINTHMHNDHAFANEVFPEATVVGPTAGNAALREEIERIPELVARLEMSRASYVEWAAEYSPDSADGRHAREGVAAFAIGMADLEAGIHPRYPTVTFEGHHTLPAGDLHLELFQFPGLHSESDVLILVPEEGMLFTGDVFWGGQLPILRIESREELERLLGNWKSILEMAPKLEHVVPGHSDVPLTVEEFGAMHDYFHRLWEDVSEAKANGKPLLRFMRETVFGQRYPEVADFNFVQQDYNLHQHNIYVLWGLAGE